MFDPTLHIIKPWDTDPKSTADGFIETNPECLHDYQQEDLDKLRLLTIDDNEKYLADHPQVEGLLRILIGAIACNRPADPRHFIRGILSEKHLETEVAKVVALQLDCNSERVRKYWKTFPFWEKKTNEPGMLYFKDDDDFSRARPRRIDEMVEEQLDFGGCQELKAPGLFYPSELMQVEYTEEHLPLKRVASNDAIYRQLLDKLPRTPNQEDSLSDENESVSINSEEINRAPSEFEYKQNHEPFEDILKDIDDIILRSESNLRKLKELEEKKLESDESLSADTSSYGDREYETIVNVDFDKKESEENTDPSLYIAKQTTSSLKVESMIWTASVKDDFGNVIIPSQMIVNPSKGQEVKVVILPDVDY